MVLNCQVQLELVMPDISQPLKICPKCRLTVSIDKGTKFISRKNGKDFISWRCFSCVKNHPVKIIS